MSAVSSSEFIFLIRYFSWLIYTETTRTITKPPLPQEAKADLTYAPRPEIRLSDSGIILSVFDSMQ